MLQSIDRFARIGLAVLGALLLGATGGKASDFSEPWKRNDRALVVDAYEYNPIDWQKLAGHKRVVGFINKGSDGVSPPYECKGNETEVRLCKALWKRHAVARELFHTRRTVAKALGLSSLERVELMMALEETFQVTIDEATFAAATTVGDLERLVQPLEGSAAAPVAVRSEEQLVFPSWNRSRPARALRRASLPTWILPLLRPFVSLDVHGLEHLAPLPGPVIFAANHQSHFDAPAILQALPARWKYRIAPAMLKEFFKAHFYPDQYPLRSRLTNSANYYLSTLFFNAFPLPQREAGTRQTLRYIGDILEDGYSILIFPEGKRTEAGEITRFQAGVGMIAARLGVPVVPVRIRGLEKILHHSWTVPKRGRASVAFGAPISLIGNDYAALAEQVEEAVRKL